MMGRDVCNFIEYVINGFGMYLRDGLLMDMMKTWMSSRPTPNMKKGWLYRKFL